MEYKLPWSQWKKNYRCDTLLSRAIRIRRDAQSGLLSCIVRVICLPTDANISRSTFLSSVVASFFVDKQLIGKLEMELEISVAEIGIDFLVVLIVAIPLILLKALATAPHVGFLCNDDSIRYPYRDSTVSHGMLVIVCLILPIIFIAAVEAVEEWIWKKRKSNISHYVIHRLRIHRLLARSYQIIGGFIVGAFFNQLLTDVAKFCTAQLAPNFIDVCRPSVGLYGCVDDESRYISKYQCTSDNVEMIEDATLSFYSGHASSSFFTATYISIYSSTYFVAFPLVRQLVPIWQLMLYTGATAISLTRVSDHRHYLSDVIAGAAIGSAIAYFVAMRLARLTLLRVAPTLYPTQQLPEIVIEPASKNNHERDNEHQKSLGETSQTTLKVGGMQQNSTDVRRPTSLDMNDASYY